MLNEPVPTASSQLSKTQFKKFRSLVDHGIITPEKLSQVINECEDRHEYVETQLSALRIPKEKILECLVEYYKVPFLEYSEGIVISNEIQSKLDLEELKSRLWVPISIKDDAVDVVAYHPETPEITSNLEAVFQTTNINFFVAFPTDIIRIIEHNQDINPRFPPTAGRTPLATLRTWMANERTILAGYRTILAKGRTGLATARTGLKLISIVLLLLRIFGIGWLIPVELLLLIFGCVMTVDGARWYLPARKIGKKRLEFTPTQATFGSTILEFFKHDGIEDYRRTLPIEGAEQLRARWNRLTPVMKRRFLASDRTDFAEERTYLASFRTVMARSRTGLACARTGIAFAGMGVALLRQFSQSAWTVFDVILIVFGALMAIEGFYWYTPGKKRGSQNTGPQDVEFLNQTYLNLPGKTAEPAGFSFSYINNIRHQLWEIMFHPFQKHIDPEDLPPMLSSSIDFSQGIWGTTGVALERTLIADRRNIKSGLRTLMAKARTGLAMVRTGTSLFSIGLGLLIYFGIGNAYWAAFDISLMLGGIFFSINGFYWYIPAEKNRKEFPYCYGDMEICFPDYAKPNSLWKKVIFGHEDI